MTLTAPEREPDTATDAQAMAAMVEYAFEELSAAAPEGWRVELIEGDIHVVPPANGEHETIVSHLVRQAVRRSRDGALLTFTGIGLRLPGSSPVGKAVPDLVIAPEGSFSSPEEYHDPAPVVLVGEVTSPSTGDNDRGKKLRGYARAGVPCYLLVDRKAGTVTVYGEPAEGRYGREDSVQFSGKIALPDPLGFELDTSAFAF
ncbi:Uma2 family endonuclease [Streptomyces sp. ACA25]|uniref:Uma2 family endonuclease n=1 Tax=Streptomyces sp. ACA25 TaxID=3022596 RepID=UPI0023078D94|nr:Uma2 family endonuclease [Streptomyces sp. ACA25]MDB1088030.1 Uma2 family endonuclease [Streptomyces sp. ACA25]